MKRESFKQIFLVGYRYLHVAGHFNNLFLSCPHVGSLVSASSQQHARHDDAWSISVASVEQLLKATTNHDGFHGFILSQAVPLMAGMGMGAGPTIFLTHFWSCYKTKLWCCMVWCFGARLELQRREKQKIGKYFPLTL